MVFLNIIPKPDKHYIKRWCMYCGSRFTPNGKFNEICKDCQNLSYVLGRCNIEHIFRPTIAKVIKEKYTMREKVVDIFRNIEQRVIEKQIWHEEGKKPIMVMRLSDLKDILESEKRRLEE